MRPTGQTVAERQVVSCVCRLISASSAIIAGALDFPEGQHLAEDQFAHRGRSVDQTGAQTNQLNLKVWVWDRGPESIERASCLVVFVIPPRADVQPRHTDLDRDLEIEARFAVVALPLTCRGHTHIHRHPTHEAASS
jgi:hypothetical protein